MASLVRLIPVQIRFDKAARASPDDTSRPSRTAVHVSASDTPQLPVTPHAPYRAPSRKTLAVLIWAFCALKDVRNAPENPAGAGRHDDERGGQGHGPHPARSGRLAIEVGLRADAVAALTGGFGVDYASGPGSVGSPGAGAMDRAVRATAEDRCGPECALLTCIRPLAVC